MDTGIPRRDGDVFIERGKWMYVVRRATSRQSLTRESWWDGTLVGFFGYLLFAGVEGLIAKSSHTWKVGVLRYPNTKLGGRIRVLTKEQLPEGVDPQSRVEELVVAVNKGDFD
jgi:hypothetical protein